MDSLKKILVSDKIYSSIGTQFYSKYRFGTLTNFYEKEHEIKNIFDGVNFLKEFKNKYKGKRCFVIGNGPSLNEQDLTLLKNEFTFGSNYIYHNYEKMNFLPTIFTIVNYLVAEQRIDEINELDTVKVFPYFLNYCVKKDKNTIFVNSHAIKDFPVDLLKNISWQSTVTFFNLQLAYWLGFSEVYLIGVDNNYIQPKQGKEGSMVEQEEDDPNHFSKSYFKGLQWQKADTEAMDAMYKHIKKAFDKDHRKVYNATHGGKLETFIRKNYIELFNDVSMRVLPKEFKDNFQNRKNIVDKLFVSINPDLKNKFGHYLHYDTFVYNHLSKTDSLITLGNKDIDYNLGRENKWILSSFTNTSWDIGRISKKPSAIEFKKFKLELLNAINQLDVLDIEKVFYMYTGSFNHIECISQLIKEENLNYMFHINLFWEHFNLEHYSEVENLLEKIEIFKQHPNIRIYVDSQELNDELHRRINHSFDIWTMFSITDFTSIDSFKKEINNNCLNIVYPGNLRIEKGYDLTVKSSNEIVNNKDLLKHNVFIRSVVLKGTSQEAKKLLSNIDKKVNIIDGVMDESEYVNMYTDADIIVMPYTVNEFKTRTSGVFSDAVYSERPILAVRGTWMGNQIEKFKNGLVFEDGDVESLIEALKKLIKSYDFYKNNAIVTKREWYEKNNIKHFIEKLI